jgi:hypothetical protein
MSYHVGDRKDAAQPEILPTGDVVRPVVRDWVPDAIVAVGLVLAANLYLVSALLRS